MSTTTLKTTTMMIMQNPELLQVYEFDQKTRCGVEGDGGYVLAELKGDYDCYISAGVSSEESFSRDFIQKYGMNNNYAFDGTIHDYPHQYTRNISFSKKNISSFNDDKHTNLSDLIDAHDRIFLKMDIEGGEYPWLLSIEENQLKKFKQIVLEFHGITDEGWGCIQKDKMKCLEKMAKTHYIVHAHGNNYGPVRNGIPDVIELTYVNKNLFASTPTLNRTPLPIPNLDFRNKSNVKDIDLNLYPFVHV